jgi:ribosomal protein S18 acetylase RimI-like enzyme
MVTPIRRATAADAQGILDCLREAFDPHRERYTPEGYADTVLGPTTIHQRLGAMTVLVATNEDGNVIGTVACQASSACEGHIRGMAVQPRWQATGIAERLLEAAMAELRARGCGRVTLDTTEPLHRAMRFYERNGFRRSGVVRNFFGMPLFEYFRTLA